MSVTTLPPVPIRDDVLERIDIKQALSAGGAIRTRMSVLWMTWLRSLEAAMNAASQALGQTSLTAVAAATPLTAIATQTLTAGLYRVSWYARITTPASVSSSLTVTVQWVDGGVTCSFTGAAMTGNLASTVQSQSLLVNLDAGTQLKYSAAYASVGTPMKYRLDVVAEAVA